MTIMHFIFGIPWLLVLVRFIQPLPWSFSLKLIVTIVLLIGSQYHLISRISSGSVFSPEFPRPLVIALNALFGALIFLALFQIVLDVGSILVGLLRGSFPAIPPVVRYTMGIVAMALASYGVAQAIRVPPEKNIEVAIPGLPAEFDGYRILQLTDLHISRLFPESWTKEVVARSNALGVNAIVITGDFIDGSLEARREDVAPLAGLKASDGIYAIPGNHEYYFGYQQWMEHDQGLGMNMLLNKHAIIERGSSKLAIAGVTDLTAIGSPLPAPDLAVAIRGVPKDVPIILLDHQPRMADDAAKAGVALQLSGHTHGGMVRGLDILVARGNNGFVSGMYEVGGMHLYVSNGTALWPGFALRLGVPSELTVFTLRSGPRK